MEELERSCPVHGQGPGREWVCAMDGPDACPHFAEEMERRIADVAAGNFWRISPADENGRRVVTEYRLHEPTGRTRVMGGGDD